MFFYLVNKFKNLFSSKKNKKEIDRADLLYPGIVAERNKMIRDIENSKKAINKKECSNCHMNIATEVECPGCHKKGCAFCFIYNPMDKQYYCESCWDDKQ